MTDSLLIQSPVMFMSERSRLYFRRYTLRNLPKLSTMECLAWLWDITLLILVYNQAIIKSPKQGLEVSHTCPTLHIKKIQYLIISSSGKSGCLKGVIIEIPFDEQWHKKQRRIRFRGRDLDSNQIILFSSYSRVMKPDKLEAALQRRNLIIFPCNIV